MAEHQTAFLQVSFYCPPLLSRVLIHPRSATLQAPDGRSWGNVTESILKSIPSRCLLALVPVQLERELDRYAVENVSGWFFHSSRASEVRTLLTEAKQLYDNLRDGVFQNELREALQELFLTDPRFQGRLSDYDDQNEAVEDVLRRTLSQCRMTWEMTLFCPVDLRSIALRLMLECKEVIYGHLRSGKKDLYVMPSQRYVHFENYVNKMRQFRGLDVRYDQALNAFCEACELFSEDGRSLCGTQLNTFWLKLAQLGEFLSEEIEKDLYDDLPVIDEDLLWENASCDDMSNVFAADTP